MPAIVYSRAWPAPTKIAYEVLARMRLALIIFARSEVVMNSIPTLPAAAAGTIKIGDFSVNRMGFGAMRITGEGIWGEPKDPANARRVLQRVVELGVNFIDTADSYGPEVSERLIAEALHPYPPGVVIATKGGLIRTGPNVWIPKTDPAHLRQTCEGSLRRLKVSCIDLYQLHVPGTKVPLEESLGELARLQTEGKIRHIGVSSFSVSDLQRAQKVVKVVSVQNRYNIGDRAHEPVLRYCEEHGLAFIPWYPLGAGAQANSGSANNEVATIAAQHRITAGQAALAWLLARSPVMLPIPGTASLKHLEENVAAASVKL